VRVAVEELDDLSGVPRYLQIAHAVEAEIRSGQWAPGRKAPSRNDLGERYGVARETAAHAHRWLTERGPGQRARGWNGRDASGQVACRVAPQPKNRAGKLIPALRSDQLALLRVA
jgi:GntR family transcriptional regulator